MMSESKTNVVEDMRIPLTRYKKDWEAVKEKWTNYWQHKNTGRPLMGVIARKPELEPFADGAPAEGGYRDHLPRPVLQSARGTEMEGYGG